MERVNKSFNKFRSWKRLDGTKKSNDPKKKKTKLESMEIKS